MIRAYDIRPLDVELGRAIQDKIDHLTKPKGALGYLETLAVQLGQIYETLTPELTNPVNIIFCADHGISHEGVSKSPREVTWQVVYNMLSGGAGVCYLARQNGVRLHIVDVGVDHSFDNAQGLVNRKISHGTASYLEGYAMTEEELKMAMRIGEEELEAVYRDGCRIIMFGEMGIGNTSTSAIWASLLAGLPLAEVVGRGSGLDDEGLAHKLAVLTEAVQRYSGDGSVLDIIRYFGGYEMVATVGAMLRAAELRLPIIIDGFIMTACLLAASRLNPNVLEYAIYGHQGDEAGHAVLLRYLGAKPLLALGMRLGEGSGAVCAYPIVRSAALMLREMATFAGAGVTKYFQ